MFLPLLLLLLFFQIVKSQSPDSQPTAVADEVFTIAVDIPAPEDDPFTKKTYELSITAPKTVVAELVIASSPPHSGPHAPLLSINSTGAPTNPSITDPCSIENPCPQEPFDDVAFYTRADTATVTIQTDKVKNYVSVYNWKLPGLPSKQLLGTLHIRQVDQSPEQCPGFARRQTCREQGRCPSGKTFCECEGGWGGRSCGTRLTRAPGVSDRPSWDGEVQPMRDSAVVRVPAGGITYLWVITGDKSQVEFRARVLQGDVVVDGKRESVDGGGGKFEMVVKKANENLGEGLDEGTRLPTIYDTKGVGKVAVNSGGVYEVVSGGDGVGNWLMALIVDSGEAVVSVSARRCGQDGLLDCAFETEDDGFPIGVAVGVGVVAVLLVIVVVVLLACFLRRRKKKERSSVNGAWTDVDFSKVESIQAGDQS